MTAPDTLTATEQDRSVRRPAEPTGFPSVDNAIHSIKADLMDTEDRIMKRMDARFDKVESKLDRVLDHLGLDDA